MIIYHQDLVPYLIDYGIEVPALRDKYAITAKKLQESFGNKIFYQNKHSSLSLDDLKTTHNKDYINLIKQNPDEAIKKCFELIDDKGNFHRYNPDIAKEGLNILLGVLLKSASASIKAVEHAYETGFCYFLGGGFHHAMSFGGRGFCLINDIVLAARKIIEEKNLNNIWIIDVDAHKGCGTAELTINDDKIQTLSIHMAKGWPLDSPKLNSEGRLNPWYIPSTIDIPIESGEENIYLDKLKEGLSFLEKHHPTPELIIIVDGSDPYEKDELPSSGLLNLTKEQLLDRDMLLFNYGKNNSIPQAYLASGGYGQYVGEIHYQFLNKIYEEGLV